MPIFRYRVLRYTPNPIRDEWVNIGVLLEDAEGKRQSIRVIEEAAEIARVRRLHPNADEKYLRALPAYLEAALRERGDSGGTAFRELEPMLSGAIQFTSVTGLDAQDFETAFEQLYLERVAPPARSRGGILESTRGWIKARLDDIFRRHRVPRLERRIAVEQFTEPGDSFRFDYGYQNGARGFLHAVAIGRDPAQAKVLAYTAERVRARIPNCEFTAITETEASAENRRHAFVARLFEDSGIGIVPLNRVEKFAEELRVRLQ